MRLACLVICILCSGCDHGSSTPPHVTAKSTSNQPETKVGENDEFSDVNLDPSEKSVDDVKAFLKIGETTTDQLHQFVRTTPILVGKQRFHWRLKDGSIWTDTQPGASGATIVKVAEEKN